MNYEISTIKPGHIIPFETVLQIIGLPPTTTYQEAGFQIIALRDTIDERLRKEHGQDYTWKLSHGSIKCLTADEACGENTRRFKAGLTKARKSFRKKRAVNTAALSPDLKWGHERALIIQSAILQAAEKESRRQAAQHPIDKAALTKEEKLAGRNTKPLVPKPKYRDFQLAPAST